MTAVTWNINGLGLSNLVLWATCGYLGGFDIVMLSETRALSVPEGFLPDHSVVLVPASREGRAGEGLLLGVRKVVRSGCRIGPLMPLPSGSGCLCMGLRSRCLPVCVKFRLQALGSCRTIGYRTGLLRCLPMLLLPGLLVMCY